VTWGASPSPSTSSPTTPNTPSTYLTISSSEDLDQTDNEGELSQASSAHNSFFCSPSPARSKLWAGMGSFRVYHLVYSANADKSQEGHTEIMYRSLLGFPAPSPSSPRARLLNSPFGHIMLSNTQLL
jgi:hypothetical protein